MKIIILSLMFFVSICHGAVTDGSNMLDGKIQDTYKTIRERVKEHEDKKVLDEVIEERLEYENKTDKQKYEKIFFGEDLDVHVREKLFDGYQYFLNKFYFEKNIWDFEQDLLQQIQILPRYSNEYDRKESTDTDDTFDHIRNWNFLDKLLFEDKEETTDASFGKKTTEEFSEKKEDWQIGDSRQEGQKDLSVFTYNEEQESIASQIYLIKEKLENSLNIKQLLTEVDNKMFFEHTVMPPYKKFENPVFNLNLPQIKKLPPEISELELEKFIGIENVLLDSTECEKIVVPPIGTSKEIKDKLISDCRVLRATIFKLNNEGIAKTGDMKQYMDLGYRWGSILEFMDDNFWSFYLQVEELKRILKNISESKKI